MKALKIILIVLVVIFAGYCIWMATLPKEFTMERSEVINAEPEVVFAEVNDLTQWTAWSPWYQMDTAMQIEYSENPTGEGAFYSWKGNKETVGAGTYTNAKVVANESIDYNMEFEGMGSSDGYWKFEPVDDSKTKVTWGFHTEFGFFDRIGQKFIDGALGPQFDQGLANLKNTVESKPRKPEVDIVMTRVEPMPYYGIKHDISWEEMNSDFFGDNYGEIMAYLQEDAQNMTSPPIAIYHEWDEENKRMVVEPAIVVNSTKPGNDRIKKGTTYGGSALKAVHTGGYNTGPEHNAIDAYMKANSIEMSGAPWEVYVTDPETEPDSTKWITEVYYPVIDPADAGEPDAPVETK